MKNGNFEFKNKQQELALVNIQLLRSIENTCDPLLIEILKEYFGEINDVISWFPDLVGYIGDDYDFFGKPVKRGRTGYFWFLTEKLLIQASAEKESISVKVFNLDKIVSVSCDYNIIKAGLRVDITCIVIAFADGQSVKIESRHGYNQLIEEFYIALVNKIDH
ncbi:MAG TPA: hypothetical protein DCK76_09750 [Desulfotomaculum sp.]|nr:hypothetical protein [Desulfotomaculum sp.]HBY05088.1 hypothetical protein [Desulfotomaculum sp.]